MNIGKKLTIILWIFLGINFYLTLPGITLMVGLSFLNYLAIILISVHLVECCVFYKKIADAESNRFLGFVKTLIFGLLYIKDLKD